MKKLLALLGVSLISFTAYADPVNPKVKDICKKWDFTPYQEDIIKHSYAMGSDHNFGNTLAGIALQESQAGKYLINWNDPSFGVHHIYVKTAASLTDTSGFLNKILLGQSIMEDPNLSLSMAVTVLKTAVKLRKKHGNFSWKNVWATYNGGGNYKGDDAQGYAEMVAGHIIWLDKCFFTPEMRRELEEIGSSYQLSEKNPYLQASDEKKKILAGK